MAVKDLVKNQNDAIDDLQVYRHTINSSWHEYTMRLGNTEVAINSFEASLGNHSLLISDLEYSREEEIRINQAQTIQLQDLWLDVILTQYALQTYTVTLTDLRGKYCVCQINNFTGNTMPNRIC